MNNVRNVVGRAVSSLYSKTTAILMDNCPESIWRKTLIRGGFPARTSIYGGVEDVTGGVCSRIRNNLKSNLMFL